MILNVLESIHLVTKPVDTVADDSKRKYVKRYELRERSNIKQAKEEYLDKKYEGIGHICEGAYVLTEEKKANMNPKMISFSARGLMRFATRDILDHVCVNYVQTFASSYYLGASHPLRSIFN